MGLRRACGSLYQKCSVGFKYAKWGGDTLSPIPTPLDVIGTFILALSFCMPNVKSWLRH